jgi:hypothetical protein
MRNLRSVKALGLATVGTTLLLTAVPTAFAANLTGTFSYGTSQSSAGKVTIKNPTLDRCYPTKGAASAVNDTVSVARLFKDSDCKELTVALTPGRSDNKITFASVEFPTNAAAPGTTAPAAGTPTKP